MLEKCPECELPISDKALTCPHCGYPLKEPQKISRPSRSKRMRLPNGFGQISEIKGQNLRKPFRAMVSVGTNSKGRPICRLLKPEAYFATYNEAYQALMEYNKNPYDLSDDISVYELYKKWTEWYFKTLKSESSWRTIESAWNYCSSVYDMRAKDLRARHIKGCMEEGTANIKGEIRKPTAYIKGRIKSMFNIMLDYALEYEIVDKNYARTFNVSDDIIEEQAASHRGHIPFTENEMAVLWEFEGTNMTADLMLIQCYMGWRPQELGLLKTKNVNITEWTIIGGMKTEAGTNRTVPVHTKIRDIVKRYYDEAVESDREYLFSCPGFTHRESDALTYDKYRQRFLKFVEENHLNPDHRAHDPRVHFVTMAKNAEMDEYAIKYVVGHAITDITEKVYTQRNIEWLKSEIEKIP